MAVQSLITAIRHRETWRKKAIRELLNSTYADQPVLIDELRWRVFNAQFRDQLTAPREITRSFQNSFARTLRDNLTSHRIEKIPITFNMPVGIVARAGAYRLRNANELTGFLLSPTACILCRYKRNQEVNEPRYTRRHVIPYHHVVTFRFFKEQPHSVSYDTIDATPGTLIPATQKLTVIYPRKSPVDLHEISQVPWKLFGYLELENWHEVAPTSPLESVQRDCRN